MGVKPKNSLSILIWGPGRGHNISLILTEFNKCKNISTTMLTENYSFKNIDFPRISVVDYFHKSKYLRRLNLLWKLIFLPKSDVLYIQGNSSLYNLLIVILFGRYNYCVFNIWSQSVILNMSGRNIKSALYRFIFKKINKIQCAWYGAYNLLTQINPSIAKKSVVLPWGLNNVFFAEKPVNSDFLKNILNDINEFKFILLNNRSIANYNAIEELLQSIVIIRDINPEIYEDILLLFWVGNNIDADKRQYIQSFIIDNNLHKHIMYVEHPLVSESDLRHLIENSHVIVNLVRHDQLSTSILEGLYLEKDMLCSDIEPYRLLNNKYNLGLNLLELDPISIANEIIKIANRQHRNSQDKLLYEKRKNVVIQHFSMKTNFKKIVELLEETRNKK